jgi:hypothetical protein
MLTCLEKFASTPVGELGKFRCQPTRASNSISERHRARRPVVRAIRWRHGGVEAARALGQGLLGSSAQDKYVRPAITIEITHGEIQPRSADRIARSPRPQMADSIS